MNRRMGPRSIAFSWDMAVAGSMVYDRYNYIDNYTEYFCQRHQPAVGSSGVRHGHTWQLFSTFFLCYSEWYSGREVSSFGFMNVGANCLKQVPRGQSVGFISICFSIFKRGEIGVKQYETSQNVIHCAYRCLWVESSERAGRCLKAESSILCPCVCVSVYVPCDIGADEIPPKSFVARDLSTAPTWIHQCFLYSDIIPKCI